MQIHKLVSSARSFGVRRLCSQAHSDLVLIREENGVRNIVLNNPSKRNVLSLGMISAISQGLVDDEELRCVLISAANAGEHSSVFSAGHDLRELKCDPRQGQVLQSMAKLMIQLQQLSVPTVAKVSGAVVAAGVQLMASCDIVLASSCSTFATPGIDLSVCCLTPVVAVSRSASVKTAALMLMTGNSVTADQALVSGLITAHCAKDQLDSMTENIVNSLIQKSKPVLALGKAFFYEQLNMNVEQAYEKGCHAMSRNIQHPDAQRGIDAFVNKKKPVWKHEPWQ